MSDYIISIPDGCFPDAYRDVYYPDERHDPMPLEEIVYCRDCEHYMDYEHEFEPNLGYCLSYSGATKKGTVDEIVSQRRYRETEEE